MFISTYSSPLTSTPHSAHRRREEKGADDGESDVLMHPGQTARNDTNTTGFLVNGFCSHFPTSSAPLSQPRGLGGEEGSSAGSDLSSHKLGDVSGLQGDWNQETKSQGPAFCCGKECVGVRGETGD